MNERIVAAQIPFQHEESLLIGDEPRAIEISVGGECCYAEAFGFEGNASVLLSIYVDGRCAMEISLPLDEAKRMENLLKERRTSWEKSA